MCTDFNDNSNYYSTIYSFLTPDEYCIGNLSFVHELRMGLVDKLKTDPIYAEKWHEDFERTFVRHYKTWPDINRFRWDRYTQVLSKRAEKSPFPDSYRAKFEHVLHNFSVPSISDIIIATEANNGSLNLDSRYIAQGL